MTENIEGLYFDWLLSHVRKTTVAFPFNYMRLMQALDQRPFIFTLPMDENRYQDGIDLRYRFGRHEGISESEIASALDIRQCSMLEMMVALSIRIEEHIMEDDNLGDRTGQWFWEMIESLGLAKMTDNCFDPVLVDDILTNFMERRYEYNGRGGLFTLANPPKDLRTVDIWYQMNWYLNEL